MTDSFYAGGGIGLGPRVATVAHEPYPEPEVTSRMGIEGPERKAVTDLIKLARMFGWMVTVTYARGCFPHGTTGAPGPVKDSLAVRLTRVGGWRAVAVYAGSDKSWAWDTLALQSLWFWPRRFDSIGAFMDGAFGPTREPLKASAPMQGPARRPLKNWGPLLP